MERRDFLALTPAFPLATVSASLTLKEDGKFDVSVMKLQPGDTLVLHAHDFITHETAAVLKALVEERFPGVQALILGPNVTLEGVLRGPA